MANRHQAGTCAVGSASFQSDLDPASYEGS
jgi:hypothetical protein